MTSLSNARTSLSVAYSNAIIVFSGAIYITTQQSYQSWRRPPPNPQPGRGNGTGWPYRGVKVALKGPYW